MAQKTHIALDSALYARIKALAALRGQKIPDLARDLLEDLVVQAIREEALKTSETAQNQNR